jgi:hypothetical protein
VKKADTAMVLTLGGGGDGEVKQGIAATKGSEAPAQVSGWGSGLVDGKGLSDREPVAMEKSEKEKEKIKLVNRAGESRSPYVSLHDCNFKGWWSFSYIQFEITWDTQDQESNPVANLSS